MKKKLPHGAYGGVSGSQYSPYISDSSGITQTTVATLVIGVILAMVFGASNAYAGMLSGLTVAAGIPGTILGASLMAVFSKRSNVLNTTMIQGMASGGESVASGMIFVLPAVFLIGQNVSFIEGILAGIAGVVFGIGVTSIVYNYLIVEEHGELIYPEAMAISETLVTSNTGGEGLKIMAIGGAIAAFFTAISAQIFGLFNTTLSLAGTKYKWQFATDVNPLLLGIGFIVGMEVALSMFAGSILANFVVIPLIGYFTAHSDALWTTWNSSPESPVYVSQLTAAEIQSTYTKYIGAGMMLSGGLIGAIKLIPAISSSLKAAFGGSDSSGKTDKLTPLLLAGGALIILLAAFIYSDGIVMWLVSTLLVIFFIFIFSIVSSKMTGDIGTSNLPVSGMTIASLLIVTVIFLLLGYTSNAANETVLLLGTVIVTGISIAGGYSQSQKVTYIMGGSKAQMQKNYLIAALAGTIVVTATIILLSSQYGTTINPPQAELMATLTQGVLQQNLPWTIVIVGAMLSIVLYLLGLPIMTIAIGFYLPMGTVSIILIGAIIRTVLTKTFKDEKEREARLDRGVILSSGLVAGGALTGLLGAILATIYAGDITSAPFFVGADGAALLSGNIIALILLVILVIATVIPIFLMKINHTSDDE